MAAGVNFLKNASVPWDLTYDELIFSQEGNFRLLCDGESYAIGLGDRMEVPKRNQIHYEADGKCSFFYAA